MRRARISMESTRTAVASGWVVPFLAVVLGGVGCQRGSTSPPATTVDRIEPEADCSVVPRDSELYLKLSQAAGAITGAIEDARQISFVPEDAYISPDQMLRDLRGRHGAECDRPDLDRAMIDSLDPRR